MNKTLFITRKINIGNIVIGGTNPVILQSMTNTDTKDIKNTYKQIIRLFEKECNLIRISVRDEEDINIIKELRKKLFINNINISLIADVHYRKDIAEKIANYVEKVRINPGNYIDKNIKNNYSYNDNSYEIEKITNNLIPLVKTCVKNNTAIRIGINQGSLSNRIKYLYGTDETALVKSALEFITAFNNLNFHNIILSIKSSNPITTVLANRLLIKEMIKNDINYPIHLGVTEAGDKIDATVKSLVGIGSLLMTGIGDTIRVSVTGNPVKEIPIAEKIIKAASPKKLMDKNYLLNLPLYKEDNDFKNNFILETIDNKKNIDKYNKTTINVNELFDNYKRSNSNKLNDKIIIIKDKLKLTEQIILSLLIIDKKINGIITNKQNIYIVKKILQACGTKNFENTYIACPTCSRTTFNVEKILKEIKIKTAQFSNLKIGVMGCIVNGLGEMGDVDYGYVGTKKGIVTIYQNNKIYKKNVPQNEAVNILLELINNTEHGNKQ